jgi:hypothetical protein
MWLSPLPQKGNMKDFITDPSGIPRPDDSPIHVDVPLTLATERQRQVLDAFQSYVVLCENSQFLAANAPRRILATLAGIEVLWQPGLKEVRP